MDFVADGLITRIYEVGVSDKLVNIITADRGRIGVMVKGSRSLKGKLTSLSQLFIHGNFEITRKNGMYWLCGGSINNTFYNLTTDITKLSLATYFCDIANELTDEDEPCSELLRLLLNSLYILEKGDKNQAIIKAAFELRAAAISGYLPELSSCVYCHEFLSEMMYLDVMGGRLICSDCLFKKGSGNIAKVVDDIAESSVLCGLTDSALTALRYIVSAPSNRIFSFEIKDDDDLRDLTRATEAYLLNHLGRNFDSLDFYKAIK